MSATEPPESRSGGERAAPARVQLLGTPKVWCDGTPRRFHSKKSLALLTYLAIEGRAQPRESLASLFWPSSSSATARAALRNVLSELRRTLGDALGTDRLSAWLAPSGAVQVDVQLLARALEQPGLEALCAALEFDGGELLAGFPLENATPKFDRWLRQQRHAWHERQARALGLLTELRVESGQPRQALDAAARRAALEPLSVPAQRRWLELLFAAKQQDVAIRAYESFRARLMRELGVAPVGEIEELMRRHLTLAEPPAPQGPPALLGPGSLGLALPEPGSGSALIGRGRELDEVRALVKAPHVRWLTLSGPPGVGKTRLALELVARARGELAATVQVISLGAVRAPDQVLPAVLRGLGVVEATGTSPLARAMEHTTTGQQLIVLDHMDGALGARAKLEQWLAASPGLKLLVTARSAAGAAGEHVYDLAPLPVPGHTPAALGADALEELSACTAVQLFVERVLARDPEFTPSPEALRSIGEICRLAHGLPLAIELLAASCAALGPESLPAQLRRLSDRLQPDAAPGLSACDRALRGAYEQLSSEQRRVFRSLAVFAGGFHIEASEAVANADLETLRTLLARRLVTRLSSAADSLQMLEVLAEFAGRELDQRSERSEAERRHLEYYLEFGERMLADLHGENQNAALSALDREHANLRAALEHAVEAPGTARAEGGLALAGFLAWYWHLRGRWGEGRGWLARALEAAPDAAAAVRGRGLYGLGLLECAQEDFGPAERHLEESLRLLPTTQGARDRAHALGFRAVAGIYQRRVEGLEVVLAESLELFERSGDSAGVALTLLRIGIAAWIAGDAARAVEHSRLSLSAFRRLGNDRGIAMSLANLGESLLAQGDVEGAHAAYLAALEPLERVGSQWHLALHCGGLAGTLARRGDPSMAARVLGVAHSSLQRHKGVLPPLDRFIFERNSSAARETLGAGEFEAAFHAGIHGNLADTIDLLRARAKPVAV